MSTFTIVLDDDVRAHGLQAAAVMAKIRSLVQYRGTGEGYCQITCKILMHFGICRDVQECIGVINYLEQADVIESKRMTQDGKKKLFVRFKDEAKKYKINEKDKGLCEALNEDADSSDLAAVQHRSNVVSATPLPEKKMKPVVASNELPAVNVFDLFYTNKKDQIKDGFYTRILHGANEYIVKFGNMTHHYTRHTMEMLRQVKSYGFDANQPICL